MESRTIEQVACDCGGTLRQGGARGAVRRVSTDSRQAEAGDLFVALRGDRFDGHDYVAEVAAKGVAGAVVEFSMVAAPADCPLILVESTRAALGRLAASYRATFDLPVIAVGGSNGKTTTKDLVAGVLRQRFPTLASEASFNNDIGVPLTLLRLERDHRAAVLEVGTNHPGELRPLLTMIRPRMGVLTSLGREHLEYFGDMTGVVQEEGMVAECLPADGILYFGADNAWGEAILRRTQATVVRAGFGSSNDWRVEKVELARSGTTFGVQCPHPAFCRRFQVRLLGRHQALNALFAIAIGADLGLTPDEVQRGLESVAPSRWRMELREVRGVWFLMDCYNANADSMRAALETLAAMPCEGNRLAVLGDMAELGEHTAAAHAEVGELAAGARVAQLLLTGEHAGVTAAVARRSGLHRVLELETLEAVVTALHHLARPGDLVLLKASRRFRLEQVVDAFGALPPREVG
jgi:UDP-N-acetylmuramoyl-tripeptide--D-alanyl-D-alanine ligase